MAFWSFQESIQAGQKSSRSSKIAASFPTFITLEQEIQEPFHSKLHQESVHPFHRQGCLLWLSHIAENMVTQHTGTSSHAIINIYLPTATSSIL